MAKSKERLYAESVCEQLSEELVDELRKLFAEDPKGFKILHELVNRDNEAATEKLLGASEGSRRWALMHIFPLARLGLNLSTFAMEDKYSGGSDPNERRCGDGE